jgi:transcription initiation factor TFIIB
MDLDVKQMLKGLTAEKRLAKQKDVKPKNMTICDSCNNDNTFVINGEVICQDCGAICNTVIDFNAEWRYYGSDDSKFSDPTRCGLPTNELLPQSSIGSTIGFRCGESFEMRKIRNYHLWNAMPYKERALYNVFESIHIRATNNGIPNCIIDEAKNLYKKISEIQINRGSNRHGIIASCIYKACILQGCPRSAKEIAEIFNLNIKHMTKGCKKFDEILNMNSSNTSITCTPSTNSCDFIQRFCSRLGLGENIMEICKHVCENVDKYDNFVDNSGPPAIAACSIYLVCTLFNINVTKRDISQSCGITEVTINKPYKDLLKYHVHLLPKYVLRKLYT